MHSKDSENRDLPEYFDPHPELLPDVSEEKKSYISIAPISPSGLTYTDTGPYIYNALPHTRVLRPLRQVLWDKVRLGQEPRRYSAFLDNRRFDNGDMKTLADTNMTQAGQLGSPLQYDLSSISVHPSAEGQEYLEKWTRFMSSNTVLKFIFGQNTTFLRMPLMLMTPMNQELHAEHIEAPEALTRLDGIRPMPRWASMTTPARLARRIESVESFHMEFDQQATFEAQNGFTFYAVMHGTLYTVL